ncbi:serine/threonine-protein phosphatase 7 long form homolog [Amaranthus tricolor]|uniref:serine/threonine-protein phosphatase 7 long form homolog n=1 Tax=Amaranthus tricolor TaxID=29722 RepID=UPI0025903D3B|nr:serine/threonine-protein phosphatase 7 long form homolog [Amaranthus tricolor]
MDPAAPGPLDHSVLTMQANHMSDVSDTETIYTRHPDSAPWAIDARIVLYLQFARLHDFHLIAYGRVDRALVTALVERWRQETHTFHLLVGEATVTLLDVAVLTRLPIEGHAVCIDGRQFESWKDKVHRLLGNFSDLPEGADDATVEKYARAYLFYLIGAVLFSDKIGNWVQLLYLTLLDAPWEVIAGYSWGSAALAYLYRRLCEASRKNVKEIAGPLIILQLWAWEHVLIGQPMRNVGRGAFAPPLLPPPHVPYGSRWSFERRTRTHTRSGVGFYRDLLRANQGISPPCDTETELHNSRKGREPKNWLEINVRHVARWEHMLELLAQAN